MSEPSLQTMRMQFAKAYYDRQLDLFVKMSKMRHLPDDMKEQARLLVIKIAEQAVNANPRKLLFLSRVLRQSRDQIITSNIEAQRKYELMIDRVDRQPSLKQEIKGILLTILSIKLAILAAPISILLCVSAAALAVGGFSMFSLSAIKRCNQYYQSRQSVREVVPSSSPLRAR